MAYDAKQRRLALEDFILDTKLKENPWEKASEIGEGTIRAFLKGRTKTLTDGSYVKLAAGASKLLGYHVSPSMLRGEEDVPARSSTGGPRFEPIPVWGSEESSPPGFMRLGDKPVDYIRRSERLQGVINPFAFYNIGSWMSPAIEHGDQVVVHTGLPVRIGADCVFMLENRDGTFQAVIGRLLEADPDNWRIHQFKPGRDLDLPRKKWTRAHVLSEIKRSLF